VAIYINRADRFTQSPNIEYSRRDPLVPTIPQKAIPVDIPIAQRHFNLRNYSSNEKAVKTALTASF